MRNIESLFEQNRSWSKRVQTEDPTFFSRLEELQHPDYLWIGCSDSRVPANQITGLLPGEVFVHRNIANQVIHSDLNCLSVLQYAIDVLQVKHVLVVGHYGCGGVRAAHENLRVGLVDNWLRHIQDIKQRHREFFDSLPSEQERLDRLCELNVVEQVHNVCCTTVLQEAWRSGQDVTVHGWIFRLRDGIIRDLDVSVGWGDRLHEVYARAQVRICGDQREECLVPA